MTLIKIDPKEFGVASEIAKNISDQFKPMLEKMEELETLYNQIIKLPIDDPKTSARAKQLRLQYVKVRTGTAEIHKQQKSFYLNGGKFVDGWKNAQIFASQGIEERLENIEKHAENLEKKRKQELHELRHNQIKEYLMQQEQYDFSDMAQDVFDALFNAKKKAYEDKIEAEKQAEQERIKTEQEKALFEKRKNILIKIVGTTFDDENKVFKLACIEFPDGSNFLTQSKLIEADEKLFTDYVEEFLSTEKSNNEYMANQKLEIERLAKQKEEIESKAKAEKEVAEKKLNEEKEAREKLEAELKKKQEDEQKAEQQKKEREQQEAEAMLEQMKAPVKIQMEKWVDNMVIPISPFPMNDTTIEIQNKFKAFKLWAKTEISKI